MKPICVRVLISIALFFGSPNGFAASSIILHHNSGVARPIYMDSAQSQLTAKRFLVSVLSRQYEVLKEFDPTGDTYFEHGHLREEIEKFLYEDHGAWKSVKAIVGNDSLSFYVLPHGDGVYTVLYFPSRYRAQMKSYKFLKKNWMKRYFACQFIAKDGKWFLHENFCFFETDGPYYSGDD
jgi:hypothetical protein